MVLEQVIAGRTIRRVYPDTRFEVDDSLHDFFRRQMESWLQEEDTTWQQVLLRYYHTGDVLGSYFPCSGFKLKFERRRRRIL